MIKTDVLKIEKLYIIDQFIDIKQRLLKIPGVFEVYKLSLLNLVRIRYSAKDISIKTISEKLKQDNIKNSINREKIFFPFVELMANPSFHLLNLSISGINIFFNSRVDLKIIETLTISLVFLTFFPSLFWLYYNLKYKKDINNLLLIPNLMVIFTALYFLFLNFIGIGKIQILQINFAIFLISITKLMITYIRFKLKKQASSFFSKIKEQIQLINGKNINILKLKPKQLFYLKEKEYSPCDCLIIRGFGKATNRRIKKGDFLYMGEQIKKGNFICMVKKTSFESSQFLRFLMLAEFFNNFYYQENKREKTIGFWFMLSLILFIASIFYFYFQGNNISQITINSFFILLFLYPLPQMLSLFYLYLVVIRYAIKEKLGLNNNSIFFLDQIKNIVIDKSVLLKKNIPKISKIKSDIKTEKLMEIAYSLSLGTESPFLRSIQEYCKKKNIFFFSALEMESNEGEIKGIVYGSMCRITFGKENEQKCIYVEKNGELIGTIFFKEETDLKLKKEIKELEYKNIRLYDKEKKMRVPGIKNIDNEELEKIRPFIFISSEPKNQMKNADINVFLNKEKDITTIKTKWDVVLDTKKRIKKIFDYSRALHSIYVQNMTMSQTAEFIIFGLLIQNPSLYPTAVFLIPIIMFIIVANVFRFEVKNNG